MKKISTLMITVLIAAMSIGLPANASEVSGTSPALSTRIHTPVRVAEIRSLAEEYLAGRLSSKPVNKQQRAQAIMQALDNYLYQEYDALNSTWVNSSLNEYSYDANGNNTADVYSSWDIVSSLFIPDFRQDITYDVYGNLAVISFKDWDPESSQWINSFKYEYEYLESEMEVIETQYMWDIPRNDWSPVGQLVRLYRPDGNIERVTIFSWDEANNEWVDNMKTDYSYSTGGYLVLSVSTLWDSINLVWMNYSRTEYVNNAGGLLTMETTYNWDFISVQWVNLRMIDYTYDGNGYLVLKIQSEWSPGLMQWVNSMKDVYTIDEMMNLTVIEHYDWIWGINEWSISERYENTYNNSYTFDELILPLAYQEIYSPEVGINLQHMLTGVTEYTGNPLMLSGKNTLNYIPVEITGIADNNTKPATVYPQPAHDQLAFSWENQKQFLNLKLYDINSRLVADEQIENKRVVNVANLAPGLYFYKLTEKSGSLLYDGKLSIR